MIEIENIEKSYGEVKALRGVSIRVAPGEAFGLLGPNGAGKSTLAKILTGFLRADRGDVRVFSVDVAKDPRAARARLGYLPEETVLWDELTAREHVDVVGALRGVARDVARERGARLLEFLDLGPAADRPVATYSRGMRRKTSIACALIGDPDALLLDEPTDGLDPDGARRFAEVLAELKRRGRAVIVTSHILSLIEKRCDRIGILDKGTIVAQGTVEELREKAQAPGADLEDLFLKLTGREAKDARGLF